MDAASFAKAPTGIVGFDELQAGLVAKRTENLLLARATESLEGEASEGNTQLRELRGADEAPNALRG